MKILNYSRQFVLSLLAFLFLGAAAFRTSAADITWTAGSGTTNGWLDAPNWDFGVPGPADRAIFGNSGVTAYGVVNNTVSTSTTISNLWYQTLVSVGHNSTFIDPGITLTIQGTNNGTTHGTNASLFVGTGLVLPATPDVSSATISGPGTLAVSNGAITVVNVGGAADHYAILDMSGLTNFVADISQLVVAGSTNTGESVQMGLMFLAETNYIRALPGTNKPGIVVASQNNSSTGVRGTNTLFLGRDNVIHSDSITVGGTKMTGILMFRTNLTGASATFRGSAGGSDRVKFMSIGDSKGGIDNYIPSVTGVGNTGTMDTTGNNIDLLVQDLFVGRSQTNSSGQTVGTLTFNQGAIDADNLYVGFHPFPATTAGTTISFNGTGTVNLSGNAVLTVNNDAVLARKVGTNIPVATINLNNNGTLNVKGNVNNTNGLSSFVFNNGGTVNMQPAGDATPGNVIVSTINAAGTTGILANANFVIASNLTGSGTVHLQGRVTNNATLNPGTSTTASTLSIISTNLSFASSSLYIANLNNTTTVGSGVNDLLSVNGNINLSSNMVLIAPLTNTLATGTYRLIDHTGTRNGFLSTAITNPTRYTTALTYPANQVNLTIGGSVGNVRWNSANNALWNLTQSNWFNTGAAVTDRFFQLDNATIDDSGSYTNLILLTSQVFPGSPILVNSANINYTLGALGSTGRISGPYGIIKQGTGVLTVTNANDFTGPVIVRNGMLRVTAAAGFSAFGPQSVPLYITNGGTYDINGVALNGIANTKYISISGFGLSNTGAVINTGINQINALRLITLAGDASIGAWNGSTYQIRGTGSGLYNADVNLNGFTLTKVGTDGIVLTDAALTNSGNFDVQSGLLQFARCIVDGPGNINARSNTLSFASSTIGYCGKPITIDGGTIAISAAAATAFHLGSSITNLSGGVTFNMGAAGQTFTTTNVIYGPGAVTKIGPGILSFAAPQAYTGPTTISGGSVVLGTGASLATTPSITIASGATLDASANGGITLSSGQALTGAGTVVGSVSAPSGNTINAGTSPGTLTILGDLTQDSSTNFFELSSDPVGVGVNDLISVSGTLNLNGVSTVKIVPLASLSNAPSYTLFSYTTLNGSAANLNVISDSRYAFSVVDPLTTPGFIKMDVVGSGAAANLVWRGGVSGSPTLWNTKVTSNWLNGVAFDQFFLGDNVLFDDSGTTNRVDLVGTIQPAVVLLTNNAVNYTFTGSGSLVAGSLTNIGPGSLALSNSGPNTFSAGATVEGGTVTLANSGANTFGSGAVVNGGSLIFANPANTFAFPLTVNGGTAVFNQPVDTTLSAALADNGLGLGTVQKTGGKSLTLSADNTTYNGTILVSSGMLRAGNVNCLGVANDKTIIAPGATLDIAGLALNTALSGDIVHISGTGLNNTGCVINTGVQQLNGLKGLTLDANASVAVWGNRWDMRGPGAAGTLAGTLDLNNFKLSKVGPGLWYITEANMPNSGEIDVVSGTIGFARVNTPSTGNLNLRSNIMNFDNYSAGTFQMPITSDGATIRIIAGANFGMTSPITNLAGGVYLEQTENLIFAAAGPIRGNGQLTKSGIGAVALLSTENAWTNSTTISGGILAIGSGGFDGSISDVPIVNNGALALVSQSNFTITNHISGSGIITQICGGTFTMTASNSYSGQTFIVSTNDGTFASPNGGAIRISNGNALGTTNGNTVIGLAAAGYNGRLELVGNITVPEPFSLASRQTATIDMPHILNVSGNNTLNGEITGVLGGIDYNLQSDSGLMTVNGNFIPPGTAGTRRLKLLGDGNGVYGGIISNSVSIAVASLVTKSNLGTWTLTASNIYRGATVISGGTLALGASGSINQTASIDVRPGTTFDVSAVSGGFALTTNQTLLGNGNVVGNVLAGGIVSPGVSGAVGTLTFANNLTLANTNRMEINRNGGAFTNDHIVANGLTYGGSLVVVRLGLALQSGDTFDLFDWTTRGGSFSATNLPALNPGLGWDLSNLEVNGTIAVVTTVNTNPTNLTYAVVGNTLDITWPASHIGWRLQGQTNGLNIGVSNNWFDVPGSTATNHVIIPLTPANPASFFRMIYP